MATGSISGHAYFDPNANSVQDPGDGPVPYFPVDLYNADGTVLIAKTTTDANGNYNFGNLADGTYTVQFETSGGYVGDTGTQTPTAGGFNVHTGIVVQNGAATTLNQGFTPGATINGGIYLDSDNNGRFNSGDLGLSGTTVTLLDANGRVLEYTTTNGFGGWSFNGLPTGQYSVEFNPGQGNVVLNSPQTVTNTVLDGNTYNFEQVVVTSANNAASSLSGTVYADANGNQTFDKGETGVAGANVAIINSTGYVVATTTTDQFGNYSLQHPAAGQSYRIVVSPPTGYVSEAPAGVTTPVLTAGQALDNVNLGLTAAAPATTVAPPPVTKVINVVIRGQSNTYYPTVEGEIQLMQQQIEKLLGFDGVNQRVNIVATNNDPNYTNTEWSGTSLTTDWLHPDGSSWDATALERGYLTAINQLPTTDRGAPTAIVMLHNEFDSSNSSNLTAQRWMSAVQYEAGLARAVLGLSPSEAPYLFVSPIPFAVGPTQEPQQNQAIAVGQADLSADPSFNGKVVALQTSDVTMNHDNPNYNGGYHLNTADQQAVFGRVALGVAEEFASSAMPGSPVSLANGNIDNVGPQVTKVATVSGKPNQLLLTLSFDAASSLESLSTVAAAGVGWTMRTDYTAATPDATGTAAQIVNGNQLLLTFDNAVSPTDRLFYTWGSLRLQQNNGPGNGNAVYDNNGMPLSVDPNGLAVGYTSAGGPSFTGTVANQTTGQATIDPFASAVLSDPNSGTTDTLRISLSGAGGTLSGAGLVATNDGAYTLSGSAASITTALESLAFAPSASQTGTMTFTLQALSAAYPTATVDSTTSVVTTPAKAGLTLALANSGASATGGTTSSDVVTGVTDADATVTLTDETNSVIGSAIADATGHYTITPSYLADGFHTFTATETYLGATAGLANLSFTLNTAGQGTTGSISGSGGQPPAGTGTVGTTGGNTGGSASSGPGGPANQPLFGSTTYDVTSSAGDIYSLYQTILGRAPDAVGFENALAQRNAGTPLRAIAKELLDSSEHTAKFGQTSGAAFIDQLYANALHRQPTATELNGWVQALASSSPAKVAVQIAGSAESRADLAPVFQAGVFVPSATDSTIARLYYGLLDRAPDAAGLTTLETQAAQGASLKTIANELIHSPEFTGLHGAPSNAQFVELLFEGAFGRPEGAGGAEGYLHKLNAGASRASVALQIVQNPEAVQHLSPQVENGFHVA